MSVLTIVPGSSLSTELSTFIYSVSRRNFTNAPELTRIGVGLLKNFPASRSAVLEYFGNVFQDAITCSQQQDFDNDTHNSPSLEAASMIVPEVCSFGEEWASVVTPWSINLLKDIASSKSNFPTQALQSSEPVRGILEILTTNLTRLTGDDRTKCIDMLLESRDCDWVVTHVARCDPSLVVPRALRPGLDSERLLLNMEGIMNNLPANHAPHIREALLQLFNEAISNQVDKKNNIIPYLLNLAAKSDTVLKAMTHDLKSLLTPSAIQRLHELNWQGVSVSLMVGLCMRAHVDILWLLLQLRTQKTCTRLLEHLLQGLEKEVLSGARPPLLTSVAENIGKVRDYVVSGDQLERYTAARVLILVGHQLPSEFVNTISYLLQHSRQDSSLALLVRIISGTLSIHMPDTEVNVDTEKYQNLINTAVENALRESQLADTHLKKCFLNGAEDNIKTYLHHLCLNLTTLLRWENSNKVSHLRNFPISKACEVNLYRLGCAFEESVSLVRISKDCTMSSLNPAPTYQALASLLDRINMSGLRSPPPPTDAILKITRASVQYFFRCLHEDDEVEKMRGCARACRLLRALCIPSSVARSAALRSLLETAMFREATLFGGKAVDVADNIRRNLIHVNRKHGSLTQLTQSHTSVFHAGIIGKGARKTKGIEQDDEATLLTTEIELLMGALMSCMDGIGGAVEGMTTVSLLLVELVSPDVMYNGLPWPDEDFTKVSIERELYMRGALEGCLVARAALRRAASARPALCYASALLRAVAATLLHQHRASDDRYVVKGNCRLYGVTAELLETMVLGQLLPHPLNYTVHMYDHLKPHEIVQVLRDCIWNYTRDNVPSPALFKCDANGLHWREPSACKPPAAYTDTLRIIIQKNIARLGHLYPLMFLPLDKSE